MVTDLSWGPVPLGEVPEMTHAYKVSCGVCLAHGKFTGPCQANRQQDDCPATLLLPVWGRGTAARDYGGQDAEFSFL